MDLVQSIRKQGSRGGRDEFKWEDVKTSTHRENYLGHSLMAPVGRWQKNKDLTWYAKGDGEEMTEAERRKEEIKKVKEAEERAMAKALGHEVPPEKESNPNLTALGGDKEVQRTIKQSVAEDHDGDNGRGLGYGRYDSHNRNKKGKEDVIGGEDSERGGLARVRSRESKPRREDHGRSYEREKRDRRRSRSRHRERDDRHSHRHARRRHRSYSRSRTRSYSRERRRSRSPDRRRHRDGDARADHRPRRTSRERRSKSPDRGREAGRRRNSNRTDNY